MAEWLNPQMLTIEDKWDILKKYLLFTARLLVSKAMVTKEESKRIEFALEASCVKTTYDLMCSDESIVRAATELQDPIAEMLEHLPLPF
ncbi:MAG: hypothetical protein IKY67_14530 [Paludibacteraceae bacterium]|nr:hypothetical protein [Paludibacteraceae bacterium]